MLYVWTALVVTANVALGERAMQSSTHGNKVAALALDGNVDTASCTTMDSTRPWWAVDLGFGANVNLVKVTNDQYLNYGELIFMSKAASPLCLWLIYTTLSLSPFQRSSLPRDATQSAVRQYVVSSVRVSVCLCVYDVEVCTSFRWGLLHRRRCAGVELLKLIIFHLI